MKSKDIQPIVSLLIHVKGLVQGVGFRPFVYRIAQKYSINGWVVNGTDGVTIKAEGVAFNLTSFMEELKNRAPVVSRIEEIVIEHASIEGVRGFHIRDSQDMTNETSEISPDIAVCSDCLADMRSQPHRLNYPFVNCTNCGPRFSIICSFPYDRVNTTMNTFVMCSTCRSEYSDISNRRFHAQPVACNQCGPVYTLHSNGATGHEYTLILKSMVHLIQSGGIVAIKGTGGFHLVCNALDDQVVNRLREIKKREGKPFAVMFRSIEDIRRFAALSPVDEQAITSWRKPIVLLQQTAAMPTGISVGLDTLGAFLPYMPIHYQLFEALNTPCLVMTSGNISEEPIIIDNQKALDVFSRGVDAVITYNRDIYNRSDDSVIRVMAGKERLVRRSRGYVPLPVYLDFDVDGILATGAELSGCFCIGKGSRAYLSQHIGDLKSHETLMFYEETLSRFLQIFRIVPRIVATDMHPDYLCTRFARKSGLEMVPVQHHHAHIASCMAENGLNEPVIGVAFDGTGYGTDHHIWGSEFLICDYLDFKRICHFSYMPMPGGDLAVKEIWRMGISLLYQVYGRALTNLDLPLTRVIEKQSILRVIESVEKNINCPLSSGAGRLFDGIAAITGVCIHSLFHAEGPMRLESIIEPGIHDCYSFNVSNTLSFDEGIRELCNDLQAQVPSGVIAARFHNTIIEASVCCIREIARDTGLRKVVLSGGSFQNKYLFECLESRLISDNFNVFSHSLIPCNDGGIALGQLAVAAARISLGSNIYKMKRLCV